MFINCRQESLRQIPTENFIETVFVCRLKIAFSTLALRGRYNMPTYQPVTLPQKVINIQTSQLVQNALDALYVRLLLYDAALQRYMFGDLCVESIGIWYLDR